MSILNKIVYLLLFILLANCRKSEPVEDAIALGIINTPLDANKNLIRKNEALIGNFICDAAMEYYINKGYPIDLVIFNSGAFRFDPLKRPSGIYPAGTFYNTDINEMLPFGNTFCVIELTGQQLYEMFERSVAQLPDAKGPFLQVSSGFQITIDTLGTPQLINLEETEIVQQGNRIINLRLLENDINVNSTYKIGMTDFVANGNDGYVTLKNLSSDKKLFLEDQETNAVTDYLILHSPVDVYISNRIVFQ